MALHYDAIKQKTVIVEDNKDTYDVNVEAAICSCSRTGEAAVNTHIHESPMKILRRTSSEVIEVDPTTGGMKGKKDVRLHAVPWESLCELGRVYAYGEDKYDDYNFRKGYKWSLSYDALQRHLGAFWNREDQDQESNLHHLAHAAWHCMTLMFFSLTGRGTDDRAP